MTCYYLNVHFQGQRVKLPKKQLAGKQFSTDADVNQDVTSCLHTLDTEFFPCWHSSLGAKVGKWFVSGEYTESGVYHLLSMCHLYTAGRIKSPASDCMCYVTLFFGNFPVNTPTCVIHRHFYICGLASVWNNAAALCSKAETKTT